MYKSRMHLMAGWRAIALSVVVACTKANPAAHCENGTCTDPNFPFCDVNGIVGGEPGACVAVTCTPDQFAECRDSSEVRCNATGNNYEIVQCERGCDAAADGCHLCNPNETACTNGKVATCDAVGTVVSQQACPLGCFEDQPRCRDIVPSNGLAKYRDQVSAPPPLDLADATINTTNGDVMTASGVVIVPSALVPAPSGGSPIRVIVASSVQLKNVEVTAYTAQGGKGPALAIIATGDVTIEGTLNAFDPENPSAGGVALLGCVGGAGARRDETGGFVSMSGGGGGGHATAGGTGGEIFGRLNAGAAGLASGTESLVPLRGGCDGSNSAGGGAIQITSSTNVTVNGVINVNGSGALEDSYGIGGGGAGGGILLEAPTVELGATAKLLANGGGGASGQQFGSMSDTLAAASGGKCSPTSTFCGAGGDGASKTTAAQDGVTPPATNGNNTFAGGGGGGLGRIRINTTDGNYVKSNSAIEAGALTTGKIATR